VQKIKVRLKERSYEIIVGRGLIERCGAFVKKLRIGKDAVIITNRKLLGLYGKKIAASLERSGITSRFELIPDSERAKSGDAASRLIGRISAYDTMKQVFIIALGGGVTGDLAGFVASVYKRGIPYVQVPTTLLAQVDSAIGGKVAIDLPVAKNLVGAFHQPRLVLSDISALKTLPKRQVRNGLAEVIKYGVISDRALFSFVEINYRKILALDAKSMEYIIAHSSGIKADLVSKDEFDKKGVRAILNFGHTIGHAIEAAGGYSFRYGHGEAVAIGMVIASRISESLGILKTQEADRIEALIKKAGLPVSVKGLRPGAIYASHLHDKKFVHGKNRFVLPQRIGRTVLAEGIPETVIKNIINKRLSNA